MGYRSCRETSRAKAMKRARASMRMRTGSVWDCCLRCMQLNSVGSECCNDEMRGGGVFYLANALNGTMGPAMYRGM